MCGHFVYYSEFTGNSNFGKRSKNSWKENLELCGEEFLNDSSNDSDVCIINKREDLRDICII